MGKPTVINPYSVSGKAQLKKEHYPSTINIDEGDFPEVKNWDVGKTYNIKVKIKMTGKSQGEGGLAPYDDTDKNKVHARFEIVKVENSEDED